MCILNHRDIFIGIGEQEHITAEAEVGRWKLQVGIGQVDFLEFDIVVIAVSSDIEAFIRDVDGDHFFKRRCQIRKCFSDSAAEVEGSVFWVSVLSEVGRKFFILVAFEHIEDFLFIGFRDVVPVRFFVHDSDLVEGRGYTICVKLQHFAESLKRGCILGHGECREIITSYSKYWGWNFDD